MRVTAYIRTMIQMPHNFPTVLHIAYTCECTGNNEKRKKKKTSEVG